MKSFSNLTIEDIQKHPIWEYVSSESDPALRPVEDGRVNNLRNRIIGTQATLENKESHWVILGNIDLSNSRSTLHFLTLTIEKDRKWFDLARYYDVDYTRRGPKALAKFLGLTIPDIFPIKYDISHLVSGLTEVTKGEINSAPLEVLSKSELIQMALE